MIITSKLAKNSEIGELFSKHPYYFAGHPQAEFDTVLVYLIYERFKGVQSKWATYFDAIGDLELVVDWTDHDLSQLQDPLLVYHIEELVHKIESKFSSLSEIFDEHSDIFPSGTILRQTFDWSYRVLQTRGVSTPELRLAPMLDFLNFSNHELYFEDFDTESLSQKSSILDKGIDYRDFSGNPVKGHGEETIRYKNRLERFMDKVQDKNVLRGYKAIWDVERLLNDFESSEDEEDLNIFEFREEDDEELEETEEEIEGKVPGEDFFVVSTDAYSGFKQGCQIFHQIKILTNRDWLLQYGIAFEDNWFESVYLLFWAGNLPRAGLISVEEIREKAYCKEFSAATLSDVTELIVLKAGILNIDLLKYYRKILNYSELKIKEPLLKVSPSDVDVELKIVEIASELLTGIDSKWTPLAQDLNLLHRSLPRRLKFAVTYRVGQKKIVAKQVSMLQQLRAILLNFKETGILENHLTGKTVKEVTQVYPLRKYLRSLWGNIKNSSN